MREGFRKTDQYLIPLRKPASAPGYYDIYPSFKLESGKIGVGVQTLIDEVRNHRTLILDGYTGVLFDRLAEIIARELRKSGKKVRIVSMASALKTEG